MQAAQGILGSDTDLDRPMSRLSVKGPSEVQVPASAPSVNELRLGRRVLELEKERDNLAVGLSLNLYFSYQQQTDRLIFPSGRAQSSQAEEPAVDNKSDDDDTFLSSSSDSGGRRDRDPNPTGTNPHL